GLALDHHLAPLGPEGVLGERRAADHLRDRSDAGDGEERARRRGPDARGLVQPDAGRPGHVHDEVRLVELGEELEAEERREGERCGEGREAAHDHRRRPRERGGAARSRRHAFSTSMMASSTTSPTAIARPPSTITLSVAPAARRTATAASSESGMATTLTSAARFEPVNRTRTTITSTTPASSARRRF